MASLAPREYDVYVPLFIRFSAILEITDQCFTNCSYCYKAGKANPTANHVPIGKLKERINKIHQYTTASKVALLGGEPLLHPNFSEIADYVLEKGFNLSLTTSGVASENNIKALLDLYKDGCLDTPNLSYHHGRNEISFRRVYTLLSGEAENRQKRLDAMIHEHESSKSSIPKSRLEERKSNSGIFTVFVVPKMTLDEFLGYMSFLIKDAHCMTVDTREINLDNGHDTARSIFIQAYQMLMKAYAEYHVSSEIPFDLGVKRLGLDHKIRLAPAVGISPKADGFIEVDMARSGSACPLLNTKLYDEWVALDHLVIRTDGQLAFGKPPCLASPYQFGNIDSWNSKEQIIESFKFRFDMIRKIIKATKRGIDKDYDAKLACNVCANIGEVKPEEVARFPSTLDLALTKVAAVQERLRACKSG